MKRKQPESEGNCTAIKVLSRLREIYDAGMADESLSSTDVLAQIAAHLPKRATCGVKAQAVRALRAADGIGSSAEAVSTVEALS
jgi:hypothetical protein